MLTFFGGEQRFQREKVQEAAQAGGEYDLAGWPVGPARLLPPWRAGLVFSGTDATVAVTGCSLGRGCLVICTTISARTRAGGTSRDTKFWS
jgi:hypothetical protein